MLQLEESASKAWADRTSLESRVLQLECDRKATAQGIDSITMRLKEMGNMLHELPSAPALHSAVGQLQWLPECRSGCDSHLEEVLKRMDGRMATLEEKVINADTRIAVAESGIADVSRTQSVRYNILADTKTDKSDHDMFVTSVEAMCRDLRTFVDGKADKIEADRLADAINKSYRDFVKTHRGERGEVTSLDRNYNELTSSLACLDDACQGLKKSFAHRQDDAMRSGYTKPGMSTPIPPDRGEITSSFQRRMGAAPYRMSYIDWQNPEPPNVCDRIPKPFSVDSTGHTGT
jgi:hypothetical protein